MKLKYLLFSLFILSFVAHADLPLTVSDILADKNRFKPDADLSYYNHHKSSSTTQGFEVVDLGQDRMIYMPSIGESCRMNVITKSTDPVKIGA